MPSRASRHSPFAAPSSPHDVRLAAQEPRHGLSTPLAHVERQIVDVERDELVGRLGVDPATESPRIGECLLPVRERHVDRLAQHGRYVGSPADIAPDRDETERERQAGLVAPPHAEIEQLVQARSGVGQLAFVDHQTRPRAPGHDLVEDLVERDVARSDAVSEREPEHPGRGCQRSRGDDLELAELVERELVARDDDGAVPVAERGAVRQEQVTVGDGGVRAGGEGGHFEPAGERPLVQGLDVRRDRFELQSARVDAAGAEGPDHERVVGIGAVSHMDAHAALTLPSSLMANVRLSEAIQDYLKSVYKLQAAGGRVTIGAVARDQGVSPASASAMVKKLAALDFLEHERYGGAHLTPAGERVALEVIRHHRLIELYLAETLGLDVDHVHDEADRLEHVISEELEARIDRALGFPTHDPHGDPIPDANLEWPSQRPKK